MNPIASDPRIERSWLTYTKAVVFIIPAIMAWGFACIWLLPKAKEICEHSGFEPSHFGWVWPATFFLAAWGRAILVTGILALILMEAVAPRWWRRRLVVGAGVWLTNLVVLFALCAVLVFVLVAAPGLAHGQ